MKVFCPTCGYANESGLGTGITCASCGATFTVPSAQPTQPAQLPVAPIAAPPLMYVPKAGAPYHPAAVAALVLGLICCIPFSGLGALISGVIALNAIRASPGAYKGKEIAIVGMVLGGVSGALMLIGLISELAK